MDPQPRLTGIEVLVLAVLDQAQLLRRRSNTRFRSVSFGQGATDLVAHRDADRLQGLGHIAAFVQLPFAQRLVIQLAQHEQQRHLSWRSRARSPVKMRCSRRRPYPARGTGRIQPYIGKPPIMEQPDTDHAQVVIDQLRHPHIAVVELLFYLVSSRHNTP